MESINNCRHSPAACRALPLTPHRDTGLHRLQAPVRRGGWQYGHWLYSLQEESCTITLFLYDAACGSLTAQKTISTLPAWFAGTSFASEIQVSPDGRFLYYANRLHSQLPPMARSNASIRYRPWETTPGISNSVPMGISSICATSAALHRVVQSPSGYRNAYVYRPVHGCRKRGFHYSPCLMPCKC